MDLTLVFMIFLLQGLQETKVLALVTKNEGEEVTFKCVHMNAIGNKKYFCNKACNDENVLVTSRTRYEDQKGKYKIKDKGNTFFVTISDLKVEDSGTYWCGVDRAGVDTYTEVTLQVVKGKVDDGDSQASSSSGLSIKNLLYIGAALGVVVVVLTIVLVIIRHQKRHVIRTSSGKNQVYATPSIQKKDEHHDVTENQERDGGTNVTTDDVHSSDGLFYCAVNFNTDTDCSTATPSAETATYSSVRHTSTEDSKVYSNV